MVIVMTRRLARRQLFPPFPVREDTMARPAARIELNTGTDEAIDGRHLRAVAFNSVRMQYVQELLARLGVAPTGRSALVIGSVRGDLARGLAALGLRVTAADPSPVATGRARERDRHPGREVRYETADADDLNRLGGPFDLSTAPTPWRSPRTSTGSSVRRPPSWLPAASCSTTPSRAPRWAGSSTSACSRNCRPPASCRPAATRPHACAGPKK